MAATYPGYTIDSYNDDVSGAFPQLNFHPDLARGNVSLYNSKTTMSVALHFRGNFGPASREPIARARCYLDKWIFMNTTYQEELNREALDLFELPKASDKTQPCQIMPKFDKYNGPITNANGDFLPQYRIFVNNLLGAITRHQGKTRQLIASSIKPAPS